MNEIEISVKREGNRGGGNKPKRYRLTTPENWNEMSREQILAFANVALIKNKADTKLALFPVMVNVPAKVFDKLSLVQVAAITKTFDFLFESNTLTQNKFSQLSPKVGPVLHGPADSLNDMVWSEFIVCDKYFRAYTRTQNMELLEYIIAVLYREKEANKTKGNVRIPFDIHALSENRKAVHTLKDSEKFAVLFFYIGCYNEMKDLYHFVFPEDSRIDAAEMKEENQEADKDWFDFIRTLPNEKFGTISEIQQSNVHDTLYQINKMMEENLTKTKPRS